MEITVATIAVDSFETADDSVTSEPLVLTVVLVGTDSTTTKLVAKFPTTGFFLYPSGPGQIHMPVASIVGC